MLAIFQLPTVVDATKNANRVGVLPLFTVKFKISFETFAKTCRKIEGIVEATIVEAVAANSESIAKFSKTTRCRIFTA